MSDVMVPPLPGERCELCHRRVNKKRSEDEPAKTVRVQFTLPADRAEALMEAVDTLQEYVGADPHSYPTGSVYEASVLKAIQQREEVKAYFTGAE
jgi:hypothetical protein